MLNYLQHKYALSKKGASDMIRAFFACTLSNLMLMLPVALLYFLVDDMMKGGVHGGRIAFYAIGSVLCLALIFFSTYLQYNATYFATYIESGKRRITLAEKLRKLPLSFFGKKDLSDLTSSIMTDCATLETASSHWMPELFGSFISTFIIAVSLDLINKINDALIMSLCPVCEQHFRNTGSYHVYHLDPMQSAKDTCTYCNERRGFDCVLIRRK